MDGTGIWEGVVCGLLGAMEFPLPLSIRQEAQVLFQSVVALILGGLLGWERESAGKWAGLRTHMLVCLACMLFIKVGQFLIMDSMQDTGDGNLRMDPTRLIEAVVTGVAFLGAGTIFRARHRPAMRGLTTAASLLMVAPIGIAVAVERYFLAVMVTLVVLVVLRGLKHVETRLEPGKEIPPPPGSPPED